MRHPLLQLKHVWAIIDADNALYTFNGSAVVAMSSREALQFIEHNRTPGLSKKSLPTAKVAKIMSQFSPISGVVLTDKLLDPIPARTLYAHHSRNTPDDSIQRKFESFHHDHPEVYDLLVKTARQGKRMGMKKWGIGAVYEIARWTVALESLGANHLQLSNNFRSRYGRLIMRQEDDLRDFFNTRSLRSKNP